MIRRLRSPRTTLALLAALVTTLVGQAAAPADDDPDAYTGPAVGAHALYGGTWTEPGIGWRDALTVSGPTVPANPKAAQDDKPDYYKADGCHASKAQTAFKPCALGDKGGSETWLVVGSSKAGTWVDPLSAITEREGVRLEVGTRSSTPWTPGLGTGSARTYNDAALDYVRQTKPDVLFMTVDQPADLDVHPGHWEDVVNEGLAAGAGHVAVLWNPGAAAPNPMTCLEGKPEDYRTCAFSFDRSDAEFEAAARGAWSEEVSYITVEDWVAPEGQGNMVIGGVITRGAGSHLTATYARSLELPLASELFEAGLVEADPDAVTRIAGANRYDTAARLAMQFPASAMTVYVTNGTDYPDALAAGALTGGWDRLLLTRPGSLPWEATEAMAELGLGLDTEYVIVGGTQAVSATVEAQLRDRAARVTRIAGGNRYETAAQLALAQGDADRVFLTSGVDYPDALAAGAVAGEGDALLLTHPGHLTGVTKTALATLSPRVVVIVGGTGAVAGGVTGQIRAVVPGATVTRVAGENRYETAAELVAEYGDLAGGVTITTGQDYPDALAASQLGAPLLLTHPGHLTQATRAALGEAETATIVGGHRAVSTAVERQLQDVLAR